MAGHGLARHGRHGGVRRGKAGRGEAGQGASWIGRRGTAWRGRARRVGVRQARLGRARQVAEWLVLLRHGEVCNFASLAFFCWTFFLLEMTMVYECKWKPGSHHKVDAQTAYEECQRVESERGLTPANLVDESRAEDAPLHEEFEWDDSTAAERYREVQAAEVIRHIITIRVDDKPVVEHRTFSPVPASMVNKNIDDEPEDDVERKTEKNVYVNTYVAIQRPETHDVILSRAMSELRAFKRKYNSLEELKNVIYEIDVLFDAKAVA